MLLVHQAGSVKVGEVYRYTLTYTPANDRILPTPQNLHVKVKNTCAAPLRAAWVHGPYTLHVSAYPASFNPHSRLEDPEQDGTPQYEPMLKAGGSWQAELRVPDAIRETAQDLGKRRPSQSKGEGGSAGENGQGSVTWIIEVASQILFSTSASVSFELLVGRDERSLNLGFAAVAGHGHGRPGEVAENQSQSEKTKARKSAYSQTAGVYSKAIKLAVENTEALWDKPPLPSWEDAERRDRKSADVGRRNQDELRKGRDPKKRRKVHLVIVTHGMHSNIGADMLFLKESIDATVAQARVDARKRKESYKTQGQKLPQTSGAEGVVADDQHHQETATAPLSGGQEDINDTALDSDDEEETIVRGFPGNAVKTENGIQYLGKRLAKYVLRFTYPDQPFLPVKKPLSRTFTDTFKSEAAKARRNGIPSQLPHPVGDATDALPYKFTSISFIGHSLGGPIQTYAIAYIHKHSPTFFSHIKPVNFICLASPMLGLSNENPMYVKFALDFGLVGRTGRDLGLTWRAPTLARGGWNAMIGGLGAGQKDQDQKQQDPGAKPLLRILPTGPAHQVLRLFRNRTVYSNVVNDGIVPLRTSCLLFLDWRGLGKVDKARRENGLIGTVAEWGWAELTGANSSALPERVIAERTGSDADEDDEHVRHGEGETVPQPDEDETAIDNKLLTTRDSYDDSQAPTTESSSSNADMKKTDSPQERGIWDNFMNFFRGGDSSPARSRSPAPTKKTTKALRRGQTVDHGEDEITEAAGRSRSGTTSNPTMRPHLKQFHSSQKDQHKRPPATRGESFVDTETGEMQVPPKTSIFESAGDILHPPLPSKQWIVDPSSRTRTIFHDRVYHPEDIPPPPPKKTGTRLNLKSHATDPSAQKSGSLSASSKQSISSQDSNSEASGMKVEEKIARAYHKDLSWRKVLVRLEPDAHNNMIVRRMFANAYGWPVIKHLCDTHFADTYAARTRDEKEPARERAKPMSAPIAPETGEEVEDQTAKNAPPRSQSEIRESSDELAGLNESKDGAASSYSSLSHRPSLGRQGSAVWDDAYFEGDDDEDSDIDERMLVQRIINPHAPTKPEPAYHPDSHGSTSASANGSPATPRTPTKSQQQAYVDGHRGLSPTTSRSPTSSVNKSHASWQGSTFDAGSIDPAPTPLVVASTLMQEPETLDSPPAARSTTAAMGLRKSVKQQISPTKRKG